MSISNIVFVACQDLFCGNSADEDFKAASAEARKRKERWAATLLKEMEEGERIHLDKRKLNDKKRWENEDSTARQARQSANKASLAKARAGENEEATKALQAADKASHAKARAGENEATKARQAADKAWHARARYGSGWREWRDPRAATGAAEATQRSSSVQQACQPAKGRGRGVVSLFLCQAHLQMRLQR